MIRCIGRLLRQLWTVIVCLCGGKALFKQDRTNATKFDSVSESQKEAAAEWKTDWDEWDGVEVKVDDRAVTPPPQEPDLFQDMQPVVSETKKVILRPREEAPDRSKFAVDPTFLTLRPDHELGEWPDEPFEERGWDEDLPELLQDSKKMLREKRVAEREHRRQLLHSQTTKSVGGSLGATRMST